MDSVAAAVDRKQARTSKRTVCLYRHCYRKGCENDSLVLVLDPDLELVAAHKLVVEIANLD